MGRLGTVWSSQAPGGSLLCRLWAAYVRRLGRRPKRRSSLGGNSGFVSAFENCFSCRIGPARFFFFNIYLFIYSVVMGLSCWRAP